MVSAPPDDLRTARTPGAADVDVRPLLLLGLVALPTGWIFLSAYQLLDLPDAPFVLLTLVLGLVLPAALLLRRDPATSAAAVLRDTLRPARPLWLMLPALLGIPLATWSLAAALGRAESLGTGPLLGFATAALGSLVIVNLWEELAWTGFFQRRAMARWGVVAGSLLTGGLFAGIHLPLAFDGADGAAEVLGNVAVMAGTAAGLRLAVAGLDHWSGRSLLAVATLHASFNATTELVDPGVDWIRYLVTIGSGILAVALLRRQAPARTRPAPEGDHR